MFSEKTHYLLATHGILNSFTLQPSCVIFFDIETNGKYFCDCAICRS